MSSPAPRATSGTALLAHLDLRGTSLVLPLERLFDDLPNVVFFIKDCAGHYLAVNKTLVERCAFDEKTALLGKRPSDLFPTALATTDESLAEIALGTGFCDQSAFTRNFRRMTGLPPGTFRAQVTRGL